MRWADLEAGAPELAATARGQFAEAGLALVGTLRRDGSPRISCVEPCIAGGELYLGMMWRSRKAVDLLRDPRVVVHNAVSSNTGSEVEVSLHGRAVEVRDEAARAAYLDAVERTAWRGSPFHLFAVDLDSAGLIEYEAGEQSVTVWPRGVEFRRPYA